MFSPVFFALFVTNLISSPQADLKCPIFPKKIQIPVDDVLIVANPLKKGAVLIKGSSGSLLDENVTLEIFNLKGKQVRKEVLVLNEGAYEIQIDNLLEGEYVFKLYGKNHNFISRVIITE